MCVCGGGGLMGFLFGLRKIRVRMTETFNVNTNKHEMFCSTVILINATK